MKEYLFSSFDPVTAKVWKERITADLKGRDYDQTLVWEPAEGIRLQPFYNSEDIDALLRKYGAETIPASAGDPASDWTVLTTVEVADPGQANADALEALMNGAGGICFDLLGRTADREVIGNLIEGIQLDAAPVGLTGYTGFPDLPEAGGDTGGLTALPDVLLDALRRKNFTDRNFWDDTWTGFKKGASSAEAFAVDGFVFKDAGAHIVQELAYSLSIANEYLQHGVSGATARFRMGLSGNFFFEIAKLRALRRLWEVLAAQYDQTGIHLHIESRSSVINKSILDQQVNMLRNTAECMAGAIGGADSILICPHDVFTTNSRDANRWARNVSLVLKHEAYLNRMPDPARGSYYLETLTDELCEASWDLFRELEAEGGFIQAFGSGKIGSSIAENLNDQINELALRQATLIGVNNYPNESDRIVEFRTDPETNIELVPVRLSARFEELRRTAEEYALKSGEAPRACLVTAGKPAMIKARVNFTSNFLGCAGISMEESAGEEDLDREAARINAGPYCAVVICSDNESWPDLLPSVKEHIDLPIILAGDPAGLSEDLRNIPDHTIHMGCDLLATLSAIQRSAFTG